MENIESVRVGDIMTAPVETISPKATVREATRQMQEKAVSALLVRSSPAGIITTTDVLNVVADDRDPDEVSVSEVMTGAIETATPDLHIEEAAAMMTTFNIKHLPVVDGDPVGMLSSSDLAAALS